MAWIFDKAFLNTAQTRARVQLKETITLETRQRVWERKQGQTLVGFKSIVKAEAKNWRDDLNNPDEAETDISGQIDPG